MGAHDERRRRTGRATIEDVARAAGVSRSTTSRALNESGYVSPTVRERVRAAAAELHYVPDVAARNFKRGRGGSVGLLVADLREPMHAELAAGVSEVLVDSTLTLMVAHTTWEESKQVLAAEAFMARRVEGMIISPLGDRTARYLQERRIPLVEVDGLPSAVETDRVLPDARGAGRQLARHLWDQGHRHVVVVLDAVPTASQLLFRDAVREVFAAAGDTDEDGVEVVSAEDVAAIVHDLGEDGGATGILAGSPGIARGLWEAAGGHWPAGTALGSFGDAVWMRLVSPQVTSVGFDAVGLGRAAGERLLARLRRPDAEPVRDDVPIELRVRESTPRAASTD